MRLDSIKDPRLVRRIQQAIESADGLKKDIARECPKPSRRIRQKSGDGLNNLEREALEYLREENLKSRAGLTFRTHSLTLVLANGCKYTVDITGFGEKVGDLHAWEVKGKHSWDDSIVKLKVAAREWPSISFYLMWKENGLWQTQLVLP